jgi:hypothetical protein
VAYLYYGGESDPLEFPDELLAHLKVVISTKLRRRESFMLSWQHAGAGNPGRTTLWLQSSIPLRFVFDSPDPAALDAALLRRLGEQANTSTGVQLQLSTLEEWRVGELASALAA